MEEGNNRSFKFCAIVSLNGNWGEGLPEYRLANVGSNEKGDT